MTSIEPNIFMPVKYLIINNNEVVANDDDVCFSTHIIVASLGVCCNGTFIPQYVYNMNIIVKRHNKILSSKSKQKGVKAQRKEKTPPL